MSRQILVVDDDEDIRELLLTYLSKHGFQVDGVADGTGMREHLAQHAVDLVLLDLGLPQEDGLVLARELRAGDQVPGIIIVTGRDAAVDRILGLELGADDYIAKPFDLRELLARVRSVLRRISRENPSTQDGENEDAECLEFEGWHIDFAARSVVRPDGSDAALTTGEFDLLATFVRQPNRALTRDELMDLLYRREAGPYDRAIDVQVGRLRRKIEVDPAEPQLIKSIRGVGYLFAARVAPCTQPHDGSR